jgi:NAD-dependent DNA ligase
MVIPKVIDVIKTVDFKMPDIDNIDWNENGIELVTLFETDDQKLKKIIAFFEILETDNVSIGVITQLWNAGYKTIKDILNLTKEDLEKLDGFGKRKSTIVFNSIQKSINDVQLSKLQHATGIFKGLGSKKLALLEHFTEKPTINDVIKIEGFAEISAKTYVDNYDRFFEFIKELPISISKKEKTDKISDDLKGKVFVFTGVRRPDLVKIIESRGGKEGSSVSKNTTHLVCVDKNSKSSKMTKAINLGIEILDVKDLENILSS